MSDATGTGVRALVIYTYEVGLTHVIRLAESRRYIALGLDQVLVHYVPPRLISCESSCVRQDYLRLKIDCRFYLNETSVNVSRLNFEIPFWVELILMRTAMRTCADILGRYSYGSCHNSRCYSRWTALSIRIHRLCHFPRYVLFTYSGPRPPIQIPQLTTVFQYGTSIWPPGLNSSYLHSTRVLMAKVDLARY